MSVRRPFRDSWEQREYKKSARSLSPPAEKVTWTPIRRHSPSPSRSIHLPLLPQDPNQYLLYSVPTAEDLSDSDDDYPERLALSPSLPPPERVVDELGPLPQSDMTTGGSGSVMNSENTVIDLTQEESDISSTLAEVHTAVPFRTPSAVRFARPTSDGSPIYPEDSASQVRSAASRNTSTGPSSATDPIQHASSLRLQDRIEYDILHADDFPTHLLRPIPDLINLLTQVAPVLGDPGSGHVKFGPKSPKRSSFETPEQIAQRKFNEYFDPATTANSILKEKPVDVSTHRSDHLQWQRNISPWTSSRPRSTALSHDRSSATSTSTSKSSRNSALTVPSTFGTSWKGRQYSINPITRTRNLNITLYERKISHGELLSMKLSLDARRDAILIGGAPSEIGGSLLTGTGRGASKDGLVTDLTSQTTGTSSNSTSTTSTLRTSSSTSRLRDSARNSSMSTVSGHSGYTRSSRSRSRNSDKGYNQYDQKERRYRAGDVGGVMETGRYGVGGVCLWRLVRVAAEVEGEEHIAWWVVPMKSLGGYF